MISFMDATEGGEQIGPLALRMISSVDARGHYE